MQIKQNLKNFYNQQASKYHHSRQKYRADGELLINSLQSYAKKNKNKKIKILELGCGSGRFCSLLNSDFNEKFDYTWVDISQNLLDCAQKDNPKNKFICDDMTHFLMKENTEVYDFIVLTSSYQHIPKKAEKAYIMKLFYKILKYDGSLLMVNRAFSKRFFQHYKKPVLQSIFKNIFTFGVHPRRDIMVPRKSEEKIYKRFYHLFSLKELQKLASAEGFCIKKLFYVGRKWEKTKAKDARNSFFCAKKCVFLDENDSSWNTR